MTNERGVHVPLQANRKPTIGYKQRLIILHIEEKERSDWLTKSRDSVVWADVQTNVGSLFSDVQHCSETGTKFGGLQFVSLLTRAAV